MDGSVIIARRLAIPTQEVSSEQDATPLTSEQVEGTDGNVLTSEQGSGTRALTSVWQTTSAIARGDAEAFAQFYEIWFDRMYHMARSITGRDESFCLDVTQDAMLRVVRAMRPIASDAELRRWLLRVIHTAAIDRLRSESRRHRREQIASASESRAVAGSGGTEGNATSDADLAEQITALRAQIEALGLEDRGLLLLRFGRSASNRLVAAATGSSQGAAHGRLRRLIAQLREKMEVRDDS